MQKRLKRTFEVQVLVFSFLVIAASEFFFLIDVYADFFSIDIDTTWFDHDKVELFSALTLSFALVVIGLQIWRLLRENRSIKDSMKVASGELMSVILRHFEQWKLSPSEHEVALMLIKGFSAQEIADLRNTRPGTVKSQSSAIYQKAGMRGRNELVAYFVEDLLAGDGVYDAKEQAVE